MGVQILLKPLIFVEENILHYVKGTNYWIDKYKLQKQIEVLKLNPEYSGCVTNK